MNARQFRKTRQQLATGIRTATLIVVLGTLAAVWHPGDHEPATVLDGGSVSSAPAGMPAASGRGMSTYFPSRFPAPESIEPQAPTF